MADNDYKGRRYIGRTGYTDLGAVTVPPLPSPIILTDRDTGTQYMLSSNEVVGSPDGLGHISITTDISLSRRDAADVYGPYEGPHFGDAGEYQLMVRGGRLGADYQPFPVGITDTNQGQTIYTRQRRAYLIRRLYAILGTVPQFAWTDDV